MTAKSAGSGAGAAPAAAPAPGAPDVVHSAARWWALVAIAASVLVVGLDLTVLNLALPDISARLHASTGDLQWIADSYSLVLAALILPAGLLGDRYGRKRLLLTALVLFGASSLACAYASSVGELITARAVLGPATRSITRAAAHSRSVVTDAGGSWLNSLAAIPAPDCTDTAPTRIRPARPPTRCARPMLPAAALAIPSRCRSSIGHARRSRWRPTWSASTFRSGCGCRSAGPFSLVTVRTIPLGYR